MDQVQTGIKWLYFSDFHFGRKPGAQGDAMASLINFVSKELSSSPKSVDAVFLAGDIAYAGEKQEYNQFEETFLHPLRKLDLLRNAKIFVVPGNHDVHCDSVTPITWDGIRQRNQPIFFLETNEGRDARSGRSGAFSNYSAFISRNQLVGPNPLQEVSYLSNDNNFPFDVLTVNTAWFCDREDKSDDSIAPCPLASIRHHLQGRKNPRQTVILGHHPIKCFLKAHQAPFETMLLEFHAIYLHGHEHEPKAIFNFDGTLRSLGFGASYLASLGSETTAPYRNSFASGHIDNKFHLTGYSWDARLGRWENSTRTQFYNCGPSREVSEQTLVLNIPLPTHEPAKLQVSSALRTMARKAPEPQAIIALSQPTSKTWDRFLEFSKHAKSHRLHDGGTDAAKSASDGSASDGKVEYIREHAGKRDLIVCIQGQAHILSAKEVESYNTRLDTEDLRTVTILSLGKLSKEANEMYTRLKARKPIEVLVNLDIVAHWRQLISAPQASVVSTYDAGKTSANVIISDDSVFLAAMEGGELPHFHIIDAEGRSLQSSHTVVAMLRDSTPVYAKLPYSGNPSGDSIAGAEQDFDERVYLLQCYKEYNAIKYAALANLGIRFSDMSLESLYVDASACERSNTQANRADAILEDHLAAFQATNELKEQLKQQLRANFAVQEHHETSRAREFCQKFGAVLVTGDPGSGKTCFVKSEILAYTKRVVPSFSESTKATNDWHASHIPIMIALSQVAAENDLDEKGILHIASRLLSRRGINFPASKVADLLKEGRLALFFDGLDEVVSVEKRALVVQHINDVVTKALPLGNRVVVTSRPAAINVVNLLPALKQLELQGLSQNEVAVLATRILALKLIDSKDGVIVDVKALNTSDKAIINQLLDDCKNKPGVARFATNPLLLTLLVMIYANSGPLSAKRHKIYEEAVKTLANVRGRQAGHDPVSAQDLRERLSAVALSVYRKQSGLLPTFSEVAEVVRTVMCRQCGEEIPTIEAQRFIQKVAESTGLIVVGDHTEQTNESGIVTFMHHSFMEYFAAVGLSRELDDCDVMQLVSEPRWREVLTLLAGIIGESKDVAPVLARFVGGDTHLNDIDAKVLIFSLDCAIECDVPSEAAIKLLCSAVGKCVRRGPARIDTWVRAEIGERLAQLAQSCGFAALESTFSELVLDPDADTCTASISLAKYICAGESRKEALLGAVERTADRSEENVLCAICGFVGNVEWARTATLMQLVERCLKKTARCKLAALEALVLIPGMAAKHWPEIINGLDDKDSSVRQTASKAALAAGLDADIAALTDAKKDLVANAFENVTETREDEEEYISAKVREDTIDQLLRSAYLKDRLIAIQLMPFSDDARDHAYSKLLNIINGAKDHEEVSAALRAARLASQVKLRFTVGNLRQVAALRAYPRNPKVTA